MFSPTQLKGIAAGLACGALWGLVFVLPRLVPQFSALEVAAGRYVVFGALALLLIGLAPRAVWRLLQQGHGWSALGLALLGNSVYFVLLVLAVRWAGTALTSLIIGAIPVTVVLLGRTTASPPLRQLIPSLLLIVAGLLLMQWQALQLQAHHGGQFWLGVLLAVAAFACWAAYAIWNGRYLQLHREIDNVAWTNLSGILTAASLLLALILLPGQSAEVSEARNSGLFLLCVLAMGIGSSWLATWLWNHASRALPMSLTGQLIVSETLFALAFGYLYEQRWPLRLELLAIAAFTGGVLLAVRAHRPRAGVSHA